MSQTENTLGLMRKESSLSPNISSQLIHQKRKTERKSIDWLNSNTYSDSVEESKTRQDSARLPKIESTTSRKPVLNNPPVTNRSSFHRRRRRFLVACGTVLVAVILIIFILVYVLVTTVKYRNRSSHLA